MEDSKDAVKPWDRPWTTNEMRQQSSNWNLAGDAGLLKHLQQFSQNLLAQTHAVETALDSVMAQLGTTATDVNNVTNQFLCLSNTQFLENRVYDDDDDDDNNNGDDKEMLPEQKKEEAKLKSKEDQEGEVVARIRTALALGMSVLDTMFDTVEVPVSDSEDEESGGGRLVLEPHNPYMSRPLPYLIGCQQFMDDDRVGLGSPSDSEENDVDKNVVLSSESESEMDIEQNIPKKRTRSSTSASGNSGTDSIGEHPVPDKQKRAESDSIPGNMFGGDSPTEEVVAVGTQNSFAADLAVKLHVAAAAGTSGQGTATSKPAWNWDADDSADLFGHHSGKFSAERGLFDDLDDSTVSLWGNRDKLTADKGAKKPASESSQFVPGIANEGGSEKTKCLLTAAKAGVATSTPDTHDDFGLFIDPEISNIRKSPQLDSDVRGVPKPLLGNSLPAVDQQRDNIKKKPAGAVPVLGNVDIFKAAIRRRPSVSSSSSGDSEFPGDTSSGIGRTISEPHDSTKSQGTSATAVAAAADSGKVSLLDPLSALNKAVTSSDIFQDETAGGDSLFSKPQKSLTSSSGKSATGGVSPRLGTAFQKPLSLFSDSDSGDDELLFSSTSSPSSRSRRSQGSGDLLGASGDKNRSTTLPKRGLNNDEDLFGGMYEPGFDIFSTGVNAIVKPERSEEGSGQLRDPEFNLFLPSGTRTSVAITTQDKLNSYRRDALFGDDDDDIVDIFAGLSDSKSAKDITQVSVSQSNQRSSLGLFADSNNEDMIDDIFAVPFNKPQHDSSPSKTALVDSLFSEESDLFAGLAKPKKLSQETPKVDGFLEGIDDMFSVHQTSSHSLVASGNSGLSEDNTASNSESVTEHVSDLFASVPSETSGEVPSALFSNLMDKNDSSLFSTSAANISVNKKPVIAKKPVISPKPKLLPVSKPPQLQVAAEEFSNLSSSKLSVDKNILEISDSTNGRNGDDFLSGDAVSPDGQKVSAKSELKTEIHASLVESVNNLIAKEPSVQPPRLEPPKTLNIRKTTGLLFSSSSNEDEDLFGISVSEKVSLDSSSAEVTSGNAVNSSPLLLQDSLADVRNPTLTTTERRSVSEKEISSKTDSSKDTYGSTKAKVRSGGASPRQLNIDPTALLPGVRLSPRRHQNVEAAVSFDHPAKLDTILHNAGKDRARIQTRRRPPSRKARQEALKTSGIDFEGSNAAYVTQKPPGLSSTETHLPPSATVVSPSKPHLSSSVDSSSNILSPSTDEEDLFGVPQDLPLEYGSNKDEGQTLFSSAPVLSPLESLAKFPVGSNPVLETGDVLHTSTLLEDSVDEIPIVPTSHTSSSEMRIPNLNSGNPDIHDSLHNHTTKKTVVLSGIDTKQQLFDTESLFTPIKPVPEMNTSDYHAGKKINSLSPPENPDPLLKDDVPSTDPLSLLHEKSLMPEDSLQSKSHSALFQSGPAKPDDLFSPGKVDDLFSTTKIDYFMDSVSDSDLFSSSTKTSLSKENKGNTLVDKSDLPAPKEIRDDRVNILFSSGEEYKSKDVFSSSVMPNSGLFGEDSPESEDLFAVASKTKVSNSVTKAKISGTVSLFEDDDADDGDLFGSVKSAGVSSVSTKPVDIADTLFTSGLAKQKPQTKGNKPTASGSSHTAAAVAAAEEVGLFEDPLMVVTKK